MRDDPQLRRWPAALRAAASLAGLLTLMVGLPLALLTAGGNPLPDQWPTGQQAWAYLTRPFGPQQFLTLLWGAGWAVWVWLVLTVAAELASQLRGLPTRWPGFPGVPRLVTQLLTSTTILFAAPAASAASLHPAVAATAPAVRPAIPPDHEPATPTSPSDQAETMTPVDAGQPRTGKVYTVTRDDTLWEIAADHLGDPWRYTEIFELNQGRTMADGRTVDDPHWIYPGWQLIMPADATGVTETNAPERTNEPDNTKDRRPQPPKPTGDQPSETTVSPSPTASGEGRSTAQPEPANPTEKPANQPDPSGTAAPDEPPPGVVALPSGTWVGVGLAAAVAALVTLLRLRRRQHYRPRPPAPADFTEAPSPAWPPTVRRLEHAAAHHRDRDNDSDEDEEQPAPPPHRDTAPADQPPDGEQPPATTGVPAATTVSPGHAATGAADETGNPTVVDLAATGHGPVRLDLLHHPGLILAGPGAHAAARAVLATVLTQAPTYTAEVLTVGDARHHLLPGLGDDTPELRPAPTWQQALTLLHSARIARARVCDDADVDDYPSLRAHCPENPVPVLILATDLPDEPAQQLTSLLDTEHALGVTAVLALPDADEPPTASPLPRVTVDHDGSVRHADPPDLAAQLSGARCCQLTTDEAAPILETVTTAHSHHQPEASPPPAVTAPPVAAADADASPHQQERPTETAEPDDSTDTTGREDRPPANVPPDPDAEPPDNAGLPQPGEHDSDPNEATTEPDPPTPSPNTAEPATPIEVSLLGPIRLRAWGHEITTGLRSAARHLLALHALHPTGVSAAASMEALWPEVDPKKGERRLWSTVANLRTVLRQHAPTPAAGDDQLRLIVKDGEHYRLQPQLFTIDLWHLQNALAEARDATDPHTETTALAAALDGYPSELCVGVDLPWANEARENLHRHMLDAALRLADLASALGDDHRAHTGLNTAIDLDPYAEDPYLRLMQLHARNGHLDAARRTHRLLTDRLADLDLEPSTEVDSLLTELTTPAEPTRSDDSAPSTRRRGGKSPTPADMPPRKRQ